MALVHERIFQSNDVSSLDFGEYAHDLADELFTSLGLSDEDSISVNAEEMEIPLNQAIPCGLIVNEIVTNSCKHARIPGKPLQVSVQLLTENGKKLSVFRIMVRALSKILCTEPVRWVLISSNRFASK